MQQQIQKTKLIPFPPGELLARVGVNTQEVMQSEQNVQLHACLKHSPSARCTCMPRTCNLYLPLHLFNESENITIIKVYYAGL